MLSRNAIRKLMSSGLIQIEPEPDKIGPNSVDLRLGDELKMYKQPDFISNWDGRTPVTDPVSGALFYAIDPKSPPELIDVPKLSDGRWLLTPGQFYLGRTLERTFCRGLVPHLDGRSTCGRLSIEAHKTAGKGDNGFDGRWTLEIEVTEPVLVSPGDRLFQVYFEPCWGIGMANILAERSGLIELIDGPLLELNDLYDGHYQNSTETRGAHPLDDK